jgi:hypothetical protein
MPSTGAATARRYLPNRTIAPVTSKEADREQAATHNAEALPAWWMQR